MDIKKLLIAAIGIVALTGTAAPVAEKSGKENLSAGLALLQGKGVKADPVKGIALLNRAATQGVSDAMVALGLAYWEGLYQNGKAIVEVNHPLAERYMRRAAAMGNPTALYILGSWYQQGLVVRRDAQSASYWLKKAADAGVKDADVILLEEKLAAAKTPEENQALLRELTSLAAQGSSRAVVVLAKTENNDRAISLFQKAEEALYPPAFSAHAEYLERNGGKSTEIMALFRRGAELKDPISLCRVRFAEALSGRLGALNDLERLARRGYLSAQVKLARLYLQGRLVPPDERRAFEIFRKAAMHGSAEGCYFLALCYKENKGTGLDLRDPEKLIREEDEVAARVGVLPQNTPEEMRKREQRIAGLKAEQQARLEACRGIALEWARKSAEMGDSYGELLYGTMLRDGYGTQRNSVAALEWFKKSANQGNPHAKKLLADFVTKVVDLPADKVKEGVSFVQKSADEGDVDAAYSLGRMYTEGTKITRDYSAARKNLELASLQNCGPASTLLADYYFNGWGTDRNEKKGWAQLEAGERAGDAEAIFKMGICRLRGVGVAADVNGGIRLLKKAADRGSSNGWLWLGIVSAKGIGCPADAKKAYEYYRKAALKGNPQACFMCGMCLLDGSGCAKNPQAGLSYLKNSAALGCSDAMYEMGLFCASGTYVKQDMNEAVNWYKKAADFGNSYAIYELGSCSESGSGMKKDLKRAVGYYRIAAEAGNAYAMFALGRCYEAGIGIPKDRYSAITWYEKAGKNGFPYGMERKKALEKNLSEIGF